MAIALSACNGSGNGAPDGGYQPGPDLLGFFDDLKPLPDGGFRDMSGPPAGPVTMACMLASEHVGIQGMGTDGAGNIYLAGVFGGTFDLVPGQTMQFQPAGTARFYLARINRDCTLGWVRALDPGITTNTTYERFAVDRAGNSYFFSYFETQYGQTFNFDFAGGSDPIGSTAVSYDLFVSSAGPDGSYRYTRTLGDVGFERPGDVTVDDQGDVYLAGIFQGDPDFDWSAGRAILHSGGGNVDGYFIAKMNSDGSFGWARKTPQFYQRLAHGPAGAISAFAGAAAGADVDFTPGIDASSHTCPSGCATRVLVNADGSYGRAFFNDAAAEMADVDYDEQGRAYELGGLFTSADLDDGPAADVLTSHDVMGFPGMPDLEQPWDPLLRRLHPDGTHDYAHHAWVLPNQSEAAADQPSSIRVTRDAIYASGVFAGAIFDGNNIGGLVEGYGNYLFAADRDTGRLRWLATVSQSGTTGMQGFPSWLDAADDGRVAFAGAYQGTADLDLSTAGTHTVTSSTANGFVSFLVTFDAAECVAQTSRDCDCGAGMTGGMQTCDATAHWGACAGCSPSTATVCAPNCSSPSVACGPSVASGCGNTLACDRCPTGADCSSGTCTLAAPTTLATGLLHPTTLVVDATDAYVLASGSYTLGGGAPLATDCAIVRVPLAGGASQTIATGALASLIADDQYVYWIDSLQGAVMRWPKGGTASPSVWLSDGNLVPAELAVYGNIFVEVAYLIPYHNNQMYFVDKASGTLDGGRGANSLDPIVMDGTMLYQADHQGGGNYPDGLVWQMPIGGSVETALETAWHPIALAVDAQNVYYVSDDPTHAPSALPRDGMSLPITIGGPPAPSRFSSLALADGVLYTTTWGNDEQRTWAGEALAWDTTSMQPVALARLLDHPLGITLAPDGTRYLLEHGLTATSSATGTLVRLP